MCSFGVWSKSWWQTNSTLIIFRRRNPVTSLSPQAWWVRGSFKVPPAPPKSDRCLNGSHRYLEQLLVRGNSVGSCLGFLSTSTSDLGQRRGQTCKHPARLSACLSCNPKRRIGHSGACLGERLKRFQLSGKKFGKLCTCFGPQVRWVCHTNKGCLK